MLSYEEKLALVRKIEPGATWRNMKTGATVTILSRRGFKLRLRHASGRETEKQDHYFAGDYEPLPDADLVGAHGSFQVRRLKELDTHGLFLDGQMLAAHPNEEFCRLLAGSILAAWAGSSEPSGAMAQFDDIMEGGGFGRSRGAVEQIVTRAAG